MTRPSSLPHVRRAALVAVLLAAPALGRAQRPAVAPLETARPAARIRLPEILAVETDSTFVLLQPSLFERRAVFRLEGSQWSAVESVFQRDSVRAAREVVGKAVALHVEGRPTGAGRVRAVRPDLCADPPEWCPPRVTIEVIGEAGQATPPVIAVSPPPAHASGATEATEDEVAAAARALLAVARTAAGPRGRVRDDQLGSPAVFVLYDSTANRRLLVTAAMVEQGDAGGYSALVVGTGGDTLVASAAGRATRLAPGAAEELRLVSALDLNGEGRDELLLGWLSGHEWQFEILAADRLGRWSVQWRGPDRTMPAPGGRRR